MIKRFGLISMVLLMICVVFVSASVTYTMTSSSPTPTINVPFDVTVKAVVDPTTPVSKLGFVLSTSGVGTGDLIVATLISGFGTEDQNTLASNVLTYSQSVITTTGVSGTFSLVTVKVTPKTVGKLTLSMVPSAKLGSKVTVLSTSTNLDVTVTAASTNKCTGIVCKNSGTCDSNTGACTCVGGFTGTSCETASVVSCSGKKCDSSSVTSKLGEKVCGTNTPNTYWQCGANGQFTDTNAVCNECSTTTIGQKIDADLINDKSTKSWTPSLLTKIAQALKSWFS